MSTLTEIRRQMIVLRGDMRTPVAVELGADALEDLYRSTVYRMGVPMYGPSMIVDKVYGLEVRERPEPGVRVLPDDWGGDGQGRVRD